MRKQSFISGVKSGKLAGQSMLAQALAPFEGKEVRVTVEKRERKRSLNQNAFMHGPFLESMQAMFAYFGDDYEPEFVKSIFKNQFGVKKEIKLPSGGIETIDVSSAKWTTTQCEEAMEKARRFYAAFWQLPYPHEENERAANRSAT